MYDIHYLCNIDEYLDQASDIEARKIVKNIKYLQEYGVRPEIRDIKKLRGYDFWEVRIKGKDNTRIFCTQRDNNVYILHVFKKKSNKTPTKDLNIGQKQLKLIDRYI